MSVGANRTVLSSQSSNGQHNGNDRLFTGSSARRSNLRSTKDLSVSRGVTHLRTHDLCTMYGIRFSKICETLLLSQLAVACLLLLPFCVRIPPHRAAECSLTSCVFSASLISSHSAAAAATAAFLSLSLSVDCWLAGWLAAVLLKWASAPLAVAVLSWIFILSFSHKNIFVERKLGNEKKIIIIILILSFS